MGVVGLSFARLAVAAIALLIVAVVTKARLPRARDLGWIAGCGVFGMAAYQLLLNWGELYVPAGTASIIVAAAPLVSVGVARILFSERISRTTIIGSVIALAGVAFVCLARAGVSLSTAVWIVVAAMVVQGIYHPLQRPLLKRYTSVEVACYAMIAGTVMTLPLVPFDSRRHDQCRSDSVAGRDLSRASPVCSRIRAVGICGRPYASGRVDVAALPRTAGGRAHRLGVARRVADCSRTPRWPRCHCGRRYHLSGPPHPRAPSSPTKSLIRPSC
ncbi:hypothetical protein LEUCIP111803_00388 [Leucobacter soli]|uniref:EamA domain-containing protein n=1 Tax=Leucobacter soli TaxID=2812850 RepID=A0A916JSZ8_9MICO|nr:hypothetical protein LEUCIP111803_00388 [Leucobacter soli]